MPIFRRKVSQEQDAPTVSARELKHLMDSGADPVILDVRKAEAYREYPFIIPNELSIAPADLPDRYEELPRDRFIAAYCT